MGLRLNGPVGLRVGEIGLAFNGSRLGPSCLIGNKCDNIIKVCVFFLIFLMMATTLLGAPRPN